MSLPSFVSNCSGAWNGPSKLNLPWPPGEEKVLECDSTMTVSIDPKASYAMFQYEWSYEGDPQTGLILVSCDEEKGAASIGWTDSWHQNSSVLSLTGTMNEATITCLGQYVIEGYEPFGWEIQLEQASPDELILRMTNIDPSGDREWAVEATYRRG